MCQYNLVGSSRGMQREVYPICAGRNPALLGACGWKLCGLFIDAALSYAFFRRIDVLEYVTNPSPAEERLHQVLVHHSKVAFVQNARTSIHLHNLRPSTGLDASTR